MTRSSAVIVRGECPEPEAWIAGYRGTIQPDCFIVNNYFQRWWRSIWLNLAIFLVMLSFNLIGDGLRDALDPRER